MWLATPSSYRTCTDYSLPVSRHTVKDSVRYHPVALAGVVDMNATCIDGVMKTYCLQAEPPDSFMALLIQKKDEQGVDNHLVAGCELGEQLSHVRSLKNFPFRYIIHREFDAIVKYRCG
jgi:hypothetical protein